MGTGVAVEVAGGVGVQLGVGEEGWKGEAVGAKVAVASTVVAGSLPAPTVGGLEPASDGRQADMPRMRAISSQLIWKRRDDLRLPIL